MADELNEFLDALHWVHPNLNDTFAYACADSERIHMDGESNQAMLVRMWREFGHAGINAYVGRIRNVDPLPELQTPDYERAKAALEGWVYEPD